MPPDKPRADQSSLLLTAPCHTRRPHSCGIRAPCRRVGPVCINFSLTWGTRTGVGLARQPAVFLAGCSPWSPAAGALSCHNLPPLFVFYTPHSLLISFLVRVRFVPKTGLIRQPNLTVQPSTWSSLSSPTLPGTSGAHRAFVTVGFRSRPTWSDAPFTTTPARRTAGYPRPDYVKADRPGLWPLDQVRGSARGSWIRTRRSVFRSSPSTSWRLHCRRCIRNTTYPLGFDRHDVPTFTQPK